MIRAKNLRVWREEKEVIRGITLEVRPGEIVGITGPSPSGKTSLLLVLSSLIPNYFEGRIEGEIEISGRPVHEEDIFDRVGIVFQNPETQILEERVEDELALPLENRGYDREEIERRIRLVSRRLGIEHLLEEETANLSGGEKQRVVVAAAIIHDPEIMLLDEPTTDVDPRGAEELYRFLRAEARRGKSILVIEKRGYLLRKFADRVLRMVDGRIVPNGIRRASIKRGRTGNGKEIIRLEDVTHIFPNGRGIRNVNLSIKEGDFILIVGPNGSGKTTLLKSIMGLIRPQRGKIIIGRNGGAMTVADVSRYVGFLFQNPDHQIFADTVYEEVAYYVRKMGLPEQRVETILREMGLWEKRDEVPDILSGGEKQKLLLASLLAADVNVFLLDEPTTSLGDEDIQNLMDILLRLNERGKSVVVTSHNLSLIPYFPKIYSMVDGKIKEGCIWSSETTGEDLYSTG